MQYTVGMTGSMLSATIQLQRDLTAAGMYLISLTQQAHNCKNPSNPGHTQESVQKTCPMLVETAVHDTVHPVMDTPEPQEDTPQGMTVKEWGKQGSR